MSTPYEQFGGEQFFTDLVADSTGSGPGSRIAPLFPSRTSVPLSAGCGCFWNSTGEGRNLLAERGHPKLRMRYARSKSPTTTVTSG